MPPTQARPEGQNTASTPLLGLDAVVVDTETTGLDARTARLVQIGAVRLDGAGLREAEHFDRLVNPGVPIPATASKIHGIGDDAVRQAPSFAAVAPDFEAFIGSSVLIGHTVPYDMTVLRREYELAGRAWQSPRTLDVRDLAEVAQPTLAQYGLERLCEWLSIEIEGRHTALGDASATARIFAALVPLLRQRGIRTLAEAEAATRTLYEQRARGGSAVGIEQAPAAGDSRGPDRPRRQLRLPASRARRDERPGRHGAGRRDGPRYDPPADRKEDQLRARGGRRGLRHRHGAGPDARARRAGRQRPRYDACRHHEQAAAVGAGRRFPLPRDRAHGEARLPSSRRARCEGRDRRAW